MAVSNPTEHFGIVLPVPGGDVGAWANKLLEAITEVDTIAKQLEDQFDSLNADNVTQGTFDDDRISGAYSSIQDLTCSGVVKDFGSGGYQLGNTILLRQQIEVIGSGTFHNRDPGDVAQKMYIGNGNYTITGFSGGVGGRVLFIVNAKGANLTLSHNNSSSSTANRIFIAGGTLVVPPSGVVRLIYDAVPQKWREAPASVA